eukprot:TRINITY_DN3144_c0_g1_i2.p1 TRINITY_DN3144_c0_g1~~TRINITY_DN3144_c0_g1_i2.p1  ORF type:complete len:430 (-),score=87.95 TRINITY_DN3144_c0_g1_i2:1930-3219(-)
MVPWRAVSIAVGLAPCSAFLGTGGHPHTHARPTCFNPASAVQIRRHGTGRQCRAERIRLHKKRRKDLIIDRDNWYGDSNTMSSPDSGRSAAGTNGSSSRRTYEDMYGDGPQERIADIQLDEALANEFKEAMISPDPPQRRSSVISSPGAFPGLGASYYYGGDEEEDEDTDDEYVSVLFSEDTDDEGEEEEDDDDEGYDSDDGIMPYDGNLDSLDEEDDEDSLTDITGVSLVSKTLRAYIEGGEPMRSTPSADTYNRVVVSAVSTGFEPSLIGNFQNFGVEVLANFSDFEPDASDTHWTPEQIAAAKARAVYKALGLPCIAECTTFEVSPVNGGVGRKNARYRFNRIGPFVDKLANFLEPVSDPNRMCQFRTVMCYYDGMGETFESGECEVAIVFADSSKVRWLNRYAAAGHRRECCAAAAVPWSGRRWS